ncbi:MAG TPA: NUDIX hydrolase [Micromonospora sp.]
MTARDYGSAPAYCPRCAAALPGVPPTRCAACGDQLFLNARPTAGLVIVEQGRFLALRRVREPQAGRWELPGGFCDGPEHPADAAVREAREELGVEVALGALVGMYPGNYRFQDELLPVLDIYFRARIVAGEITPDPAEADAVEWFDLGDPPPLAFSTMDAALRDLHRT